MSEADAMVPSQVRGSSFYAAMRILPPPQRAAMYAIYDFCRAVDDIADEAGPLPARKAALDKWRADIDSLYTDGPVDHSADPGLADLREAARRFALERADFHAVIDGMAMDVEQDIQAPDAVTLDLYCDRVASAVGRLSVKIFGVPPAEGPSLAHHLGRAFQLTNILRDIDDDAAINRLYLPREALQAAGIATTAPREVAARPLNNVCAPLVARAQDHFAEAMKIMRRCPRASVKAPRIMGEAYRGILDRLVARGFAPPRQHVKTPRGRLLLALLRYAIV